MSRLSLWTWNVNGLDEHLLDERTEAACLTVFLREHPPDVVLLQEIVHRSWHAHWKHHLRAAGYSVFPEDPTRTSSEYFSLAAVRADLSPTNARREPFANSEMGRALVSVEVGNWWIATSHLESGKASSDVRVAQLSEILVRLAAFPGPAVFAGDTNLRVEEERRLPVVPVADAWVAMGARSRDRATWLGGKIGARFDRVYLNARVRPVSFVREAAEPLPDFGYLSDHAALVVTAESVDG